MGKRAPLATSREIYDRLRWDPSLDAREVAVVFEDRARGLASQPLEDFTPGAPVPWSRVRRFTLGERVLWDREARLDRLSSGEALAWLRAPSPEPTSPELEPLQAWRWGAEGWVEATPGPASGAGRLRVFTWNILFDLYDDEPVRTEERLPAILEVLRGCEADLITLQEVTPSLLAHLSADPVLRRSYLFSDVTGETLRPYGQLLLSRLPLARLAMRRLSQTKRLLFATLQLGARPLELCVVHLTSDRRGDGHAQRARQAERLLETLGEGDALLVGDFNFGDAQRLTSLEQAGFVDLWPALRPDDPGCSFDPQANPLAALTSRRGEPRRLDRVWLKAARLRPVGAWLEGLRPLGPAGDLAASDHYALGVDLALDGGPLTRARSEPGCAAVIVPPSGAWGPIQAMREGADRAFPRWMPHITLLHPFVEAEALEAAAGELARALAHVPPFEVALERLSTFPGARKQAVWLEARSEPPGALQALRAALAALFPQCVEREGFTPHLSVGQVPIEEVEARVKAWSEAWQPQRFTVRHVSLLQRGEEGVFEICHSVPLLGERRAEVLDLLRELAPPAGRLERMGSEALGVAEADSDLDLLALLPPGLEVGAYLEGLAARLSGLADGPALQVEARTPLVRARLMGVEVEVCAARLPTEGARLTPLLLEEMPREDRRAAAGVVHAQAILRHVQGLGAEAAWRAALRALRRWARARELTGDAFGLLGGLSWALLATQGAAPGATPAEVLRASLEALGSGAPLGFPGESGPRREGPALTLLTPLGENSARNVTPGTARLLRREAREAVAHVRAAMSGERPWSTLLEPVRREGPRLRLRLEEVPGAEGRFKGLVVGLIQALETAGCRPRPFSQAERAGGRISWEIGLGGDPAGALGLAWQLRAGPVGEGAGGPLEVELEGSA